MAHVVAAPFVRKGAGPASGEEAANALLVWARIPLPYKDVFWAEPGCLDAHTLQFVNWCLRNEGLATLAVLRARPEAFAEVHASIQARCHDAVRMLRFPNGGFLNDRSTLAQRFDSLNECFADLASGGDGYKYLAGAHLIPKRTVPRPRAVRLLAIEFRRRLAANGWRFRGAWAEKKIGSTLLVISGTARDGKSLIGVLSARRLWATKDREAT